MDLQPLNYQSPPRPAIRTKWGPAPTDPESRKWRLYRGVFRFGLLVLFAPIAFYLGPNLMTFGKLTPRTISDFVPLVQRDDVPVITAIKQYERDTGQLPDSISKVTPKYLPGKPFSRADIYPDQKIAYFFDQLQETVVYNFDPTREGWSVRGYFVSGTLPISPVKLPPPRHQ